MCRTLPGGLVATVAVAVLVGGLAACEQEPEEEPEVLVRAKPDAVEEGQRMWVQLPTGRLSLTVGEPVTTIPEEKALGPEEVTAPEGRTFLPVAKGMNGKGVPTVLSLADNGTQGQPEVSLRVGEEQYRLGDMGRAAYVQVPESEVGRSDLELVVEFDGVTQSVDEDGTREPEEVAGLYDLPEQLDDQDCSGGWRTAPGVPTAEVAMRCHVNATNYPYLPGHGWAHEREPGHTWAVMLAATTFESAVLAGPAGGPECRPAADGSGRIELEGASETVELDRQVGRAPGGSLVAETVAFLAPEQDQGELRISRTHECRTDRGDQHRLELTGGMRVDLSARR